MDFQDLFLTNTGRLNRQPFWIGVLVAAVYVIGAMAQLIVGHFVDRHPLRTVFLPLSLI